jgi:hypothetical protein
MSTELKGISIQWILAGVILSFNVIGVLCVREWIHSRRLDLLMAMMLAIIARSASTYLDPASCSIIP